ncbi:unnamed protein product [Rangifer tarandus platyrhynchus]|uniref:Uncharacterized protein n=1 Tax=Rangifer tarandus platyrhynchus TaxID=3082113 RepID=A0AC59ZYD1_RANTA
MGGADVPDGAPKPRAPGQWHASSRAGGIHGVMGRTRLSPADGANLFAFTVAEKRRCHSPGRSPIEGPAGGFSLASSCVLWEGAPQAGQEQPSAPGRPAQGLKEGLWAGVIREGPRVPQQGKEEGESGGGNTLQDTGEVGHKDLGPQGIRVVRADDPGPGTCVIASGSRDPVAVVQIGCVVRARSGTARPTCIPGEANIFSHAAAQDRWAHGSATEGPTNIRSEGRPNASGPPSLRHGVPTGSGQAHSDQPHGEGG